MKDVKTYIKIGAAIIVLVIVLNVMTSWFYTIGEGDRGILLRNGKFIEVVQPGLHFKLPIFDNVVVMSIRMQKLEVPLLTYSKDIQAASVQMFVNYHVTDIEKVYKNLGLSYPDTYLLPIALNESKAIFGQFTAVDIIGKREQMSADINHAVLLRTKDSGITLDAVNIANIDFSDDYERAVEERMKAEVEVQKLNQMLSQEKINADIVRTKAQGAADSQLAQAKSYAEATRIQGEAQAAAITAKGKAVAMNPLLIQLTVAEKWDGQMPQTMLPNGATPLLDLRSVTQKAEQ